LSCSSKVFDYDKISKDDLNYYLKFAAYYKETFSQSIPGNVILKGAHSFESNALNLLKESNYNINIAMRKILFPVIDLLEETRDTEMVEDAVNLMNYAACKKKFKNFYILNIF
jgi:hypothetical protein